MIKISRAAEPTILASRGKTQTDVEIAKVTANPSRFTDGIEKLEFDSTIYGHQSVKEALKTMQHEKCCFCESKITHIAHGDVEHFRPKAAWYSESIKGLVRPGYFWLAYAWNNLLYCCQVCNQRHKRNHFPLSDETSRCTYPNTAVHAESPLFINPADEEPNLYIGFRGDAAYAIRGQQKGIETIKGLQLNRKEIRLRRSEKLEMLKMVYQIAMLQIPVSPEDQRAAEALLDKYSGEQAEYSATVRSAITDGFRYV